MELQVPIIACASPIEITSELNLLGAVITKTQTLQPNEGRFDAYREYDSGTTWNNQGLPNLGIDGFIEKILPRYIETIKENVPIILSIYTDSLFDLHTIIDKINKVKNHIFGIELNVSCPNHVSDKKLIHDHILIIDSLCDIWDKFISVKLSPSVSDDELELLLDNSIRWINCFNSVPLSSVCYNLTGSVSGKFLKDIYLGRIQDIYKKYPEFKIIATGGITNAKDVTDYLNCGATLTGVASHFLKSKHNIQKIVMEYIDSRECI